MTVQFSAIASTMTDVCAKYVTKHLNPVICLQGESAALPASRFDDDGAFVRENRGTGRA